MKMDKILLNNMQFYGFHGLLPEENKLGQRFNVDVTLFTDLQKPGQSDEMHDSIHYGHAYELVQKTVEGEAKNLIEAEIGRASCRERAGRGVDEAARLGDAEAKA